MTFLNPAVLFGLIAAAIPIIIHFLTRQKAKEIPFSSLRFLKQLENQQIRRLRWKQILLLILRTLIILFIVIAFARPTLKNRSFLAIGSRAKTAAVIILDNSLSMSAEQNGITLFDRARQIAYQLADNFSVGDEIYGLFSTPGAPPIFEGVRYDYNSVKKIIQKTQISQRPTSFIEAVLKAKELLENAKPINKEIYLISDFQKIGWKDSSSVVFPLLSDLENQKIHFIAIPVEAKTVTNLAILNVSVSNQIIEINKVMEVNATIKNTGNRPAKNKLVQIFLNGKRVNQSTLSLDPGETRTVTFKIIPEKSGPCSGYVSLEDDDLFGDNQRFFAFNVPERVNSLLIAPKENDIKFFKLALNPVSEANSIISLQYKNPDNINLSDIKDFDVLILVNLPRANQNLINAVKNHLQNGKGLIFFPGSDMDLRQFNDEFNRKFNMPEFVASEGKIGQKEFFLSLGKFDRDHSIFSGVFEEKNSSFSSPQFNFLLKLKTGENQKSIINFSDGSPFLVESKYGNSRILTFASTADAQWSDLHLRGIFVPLMHRCVMYAANSDQELEKLHYVGEPLNISLQAIKNYQNLEIEKPGGLRQKLVPTLTNNALAIRFKDTDAAGIYKLFQENKLLENLPVNILPEESDLSPVSRDEVEKIVGNSIFIDVEKNPNH